jgi:hypothetical protein
MGLFSIKRAKPKQETDSFAVEKVESKPEPKDTLEIENEKLDREMSREIQNTGEQDNGI